MTTRIQLASGESVEKVLYPCPLSFFRFYVFPLMLLVWGIIMRFYMGDFSISIIYKLGLWWIGLLAMGYIGSYFFVTKSFFLSMIGIGILGSLIYFRTSPGFSTVIPLYTTVMAGIMFLVIDIYRRSHKYILTNKRIVLTRKLGSLEKRSFTYDNITDLRTHKSFLGRLCAFGTITPITPSGFGLGADKSFAAGIFSYRSKKGLQGGFVGGSGREQNLPRTKTYYELFGIRDVDDVAEFIEERIQKEKPTPHIKDGVDVLEDIRDQLQG